MYTIKSVGKREFIQHTSKYLKWVEEHDKELIVTHQNEPDLIITKIKKKSFRDLRGFADIKIHGDINEHVFLGYDQW
jgi:hypothetical protein